MRKLFIAGIILIPTFLFGQYSTVTNTFQPMSYDQMYRASESATNVYKQAESEYTNYVDIVNREFKLSNPNFSTIEYYTKKAIDINKRFDGNMGNLGNEYFVLGTALYKLEKYTEALDALNLSLIYGGDKTAINNAIKFIQEIME